MDEENQHGHEATVRLPLHPRKAQELFFELIQVPSPHTVHPSSPRTIPSPRSFQHRVAHTQQFCTDALTDLQRGHWVKPLDSKGDDAPRLVRLRLSKNGAALELQQFPAGVHIDATQQEQEQEQEQTHAAASALECIASLAVASIQSLTIFPNACFLLRTKPSAATTATSLFHSLLEAEGEEVLTRIAVAVASSVSAHSDSTTVVPSKETSVLLWEAVRLRMIELTTGSENGVSLREASAVMESAYETLRMRETQSELPSLAELFLVRSG